jgi:NarL family two-component system response regulator LiaR
MSISLVIVEDDPVVLKGLVQLLNFSEEIDVQESFGSAEDFLENVDHLSPEVVLMDIGLPKMNGIDCVEIVKRKHPDIQFLMCTNFDDDQNVFDALRVGANGYVLKNADVQTIIQSISEVYRGGSPMSRSIARKVIESFHSQGLKDIKYNLSKRETEILNLLAKGYRYKEIGAQLFISTETVRTHIRNIYSKLQVQSRTEAINKYYHK